MSERQPLPEQAAKRIAACVHQVKLEETWDEQKAIDLAVVIIDLIQHQVTGIPGAPEVSVADEASKIAAAVTTRQWLGPEQLEQWIMILLQRTVDPILKRLATEVRPCKGYRCGRVLAMVPDNTRGGMLTPFDFGTAVNHFVTCPDRERFKRPAGSVDPKKPLPPDPVTRTVEAVDAGQLAMFDLSRRPQ